MRISRVVAVLAGVLACGCGGDDDADTGDDAGDDGGLDSSTPLSDLSQADRVELCEEITATFADIIPQQHTVSCYLIFMNQGETCEAEVEECLMELISGPPDTCGWETPAELPPCPDLTVGHMRACFDSTLELWTEVAEGISCAGLPAGWTQEDLVTTEECELLFELCPTL